MRLHLAFCFPPIGRITSSPFSWWWNMSHSEMLPSLSFLWLCDLFDHSQSHRSVPLFGSYLLGTRLSLDVVCRLMSPLTRVSGARWTLRNADDLPLLGLLGFGLSHERGFLPFNWKKTSTVFVQRQYDKFWIKGAHLTPIINPSQPDKSKWHIQSQSAILGGALHTGECFQGHVEAKSKEATPQV